MSKKISASGGLPRQQTAEDEQFQHEFDKIFHNEKVDVAHLNPNQSGDVDQERKNYYRSASDAVGLDHHAFVEDSDEPRTDQGVRQAASEGNFNRDLAGDHSKHDFAHNNPILTKRKSSHGQGKHKKSSDVGLMKADSTAEQLTDIPEDKDKDADGLNLPWKISREDEPVKYTEEKETLVAEDDNPGVKFSIGFIEDDEDPEEEKEHHKEKGHRRASHHIKKISKTEKHTEEAKRKKSKGVTSLADESGNLQEADLEEIEGHRFEKAKGLSVPKYSHNKKVLKVGRDDMEMGERTFGYGHRTDIDHTAHPLFIEMDELEGEEWQERARWIKYEEDLEAEKGEWGKPHVSSLTFHSMINLRINIETGTMLLDISVKDFPSLVHRVVEDLSEKGIIEEHMKEKILRVLLFRHKHVHPHEKTFKLGLGLRRTMSQRSMQSLGEEKNEKSNHDMLNLENGFSKEAQNFSAQDGLKRTGSFVLDSFRRIDSTENMMKARKKDILSYVEEGTEGAVVLVGADKEIEKPIVAFVRLAQAIIMPNTIEAELPVRFIFILLTPSGDFNLDPHEIGRSFSTLMSNPKFAMVAYKVEEKHELLNAINTFLDDSVVLPPGDWDRKHIMPINEIMEMKQRRKERQNLNLNLPAEMAVETQSKGDDEKADGEPPKRNPMQRTKVPFGGLIDDIKERYPKYLSDFKDGLNPQCLAATIFIYFACLSGGIAFGGLMAEKTQSAIGISETLIISCVAGIFYSLFSGCPLIIIGSTGPMLLFDEALFGFSENFLPGKFLYWRTWVGIWTFVISLAVACVQGSTLVQYFTKFIKDIFAFLISLVFIYEAVNKLAKIFAKNSLMAASDYCDAYVAINETCSMVSMMDGTAEVEENKWSKHCEDEEPRGPQPNTALLSAILMFGTFFIAYFLRIFRNSQFLGKYARRALGDFGVPIGIVIMVMVDFLSGDVFTEKLFVPEGISVTNSTKRDWFINPLGEERNGEDLHLAVWAMFAGFLPALLLYLLLFIETHICELIMMEKTKEEKGAGLHLDIVIISLINLGCGLFGGPWICAATVRAVAHVSALTVHATSGIPGEGQKTVGVRDQRVTFLVVSIMLGISIVLGPVLRKVPFAVLFGVFLYMGVSGMNGIQFFDRVKLFIMPTKHHPSISYVKKMKTWRMHMFTILQLIGLVILWVVKSSSAALAFPFFVMAMIPYRWSMKFLFSPSELDALDGPHAGQNYDKDEDEEEDFYEAANAMPVRENNVTVALHRSLMGIVNIPQIMGNTSASKK